MKNQVKSLGYISMVGGILAILMAPLLVITKYLTGWSVVPQPGWIDQIMPLIEPLLSFTTPVGLWQVYGGLYSTALLLMIIAFGALWPLIKGKKSTPLKTGYWALFAGLIMVLIGDAVHTATWHQNGLTIPTPGSNLIANTGYATGMMGMNFILIGSLIFGISALKNGHLSKWLAWSFIFITPSAPLLTLTILPTTPSGGLLFFSLLILVIGWARISGRIPIVSTTRQLN